MIILNSGKASTSPGDGSEVHVHANQVPFKERVIGEHLLTVLPRILDAQSLSLGVAKVIPKLSI